MMIEAEYLGEPKLQFGDFFEYEDAKTGLADFGPYGKSVPGLHPSEIKLGFVGTRETIAGAREWIETLGGPIESENVKTTGGRKRGNTFGPGLFDTVLSPTQKLFRVEKILNRDFVGFNRNSAFASCFQMNERWERPIRPIEIAGILDKIQTKKERIWELVDLFDEYIESLASTGPSPDVVILALPDNVIEQAHSVPISGNFHLNLRRALKARAMQYGMPIQLLKERTVAGDATVQEPATRAWNFTTALYYKAEGIPWRPMTLERDTCYIGISFYVAQDIDEKLTMRSSVAQAFDYLGQGLVLRGEPFKWDEVRLGRSPHLPKEAARQLIRQTLEQYAALNRMPPSRVVIHKTSEYWGSDHSEYNELDGFLEGIEQAYRGCDYDLVSIRQTGAFLMREGNYPPLRGTYFSLGGEQHFLYTMGFVPYLETYPGSYVPRPWQITDHRGSSRPKDLFREILALTKMNVNNCSYADGTPITLSFSKMVGEIMKHIPEGGMVQPKYKFYM